MFIFDSYAQNNKPSPFMFLKPIFLPQAFDMTPDQITKYFENTEDHPKFKKINNNTKFFHDNLIKKVKEHKIGEGDRGMKTVEEICLPKPKKELEYITIEEVQGKVIDPKANKMR